MTPQVLETCSRMKHIRKRLKVSQKDFAASVGMSQGHLCVIERQERPPSVTLLKAICHEYKVSLDWLLTGEGEPFASSASDSGIPVFSRLPENYPEDSGVEDIIGYISLPGLPKDGFAIYQRGDYMSPTVHARDLMVCEPAGTFANDDLVLARNKWGTWIIRRFRKIEEKIVLTPDNSAYNAFECGQGEEHILAKVSVILRSVNF